MIKLVLASVIAWWFVGSSNAENTLMLINHTGVHNTIDDDVCFPPWNYGAQYGTHAFNVMADGTLIECGLFRTSYLVLGKYNVTGVPTILNEDDDGSKVWLAAYIALRNPTTYQATWGASITSWNYVSSDIRNVAQAATPDPTNTDAFYAGGISSQGSTGTGGVNVSGVRKWFKGIWFVKYNRNQGTPVWINVFNNTIYGKTNAMAQLIYYENVHKMITVKGAVYAVGNSQGNLTTLSQGKKVVWAHCSPINYMIGWVISINTTTGSTIFVKRLCIKSATGSWGSEAYYVNVQFFSLAYVASGSYPGIFVAGNARGTLTDGSGYVYATPTIFGQQYGFVARISLAGVWQTSNFLLVRPLGYETDVIINDIYAYGTEVYVTGIVDYNTSFPGYGYLGNPDNHVLFLGKLSANYSTFAKVAPTYGEYDMADYLGYYVLDFCNYLYKPHHQSVFVDDNFIYHMFSTAWSVQPFNTSSNRWARMTTAADQNVVVYMVHRSNFTYYMGAMQMGYSSDEWPTGVVAVNGVIQLMMRYLPQNNAMPSSFPWGTMFAQGIICYCDHGVCNNSRVCRCDDGWAGTRCNVACNCGGTSTCVDGACKCSPQHCLNGGTCYSVNNMTLACVCPSGFYGTRCQNACTANSIHGQSTALYQTCLCNAGYSLSGTTCSPCAIGYYKDHVSTYASENCTACPSPTTTNTTGATSSSRCS